MPKLKINTDSITEEQENGLRLQLLRNKLEKVLREQFHNHFPIDPYKLYQQFEKFRKRFEDLRKRGKISKEQFQLLLPKNDIKTLSEEFDTSLLLILLFEFCGLHLPKPGWKPEPTDRSEIANIIRFRTGRNNIQHKGISVSNKEFAEIFDTLKEPLLDFGCTSIEVEKLKTRILDNAAKQRIQKLEQSYDNFNYNYILPVANFIGRDEEIECIHKSLLSINEDITVNGIEKYGVVLSGMAGVGKTEIIRKYWTKYSKIYYENSIIWINGQSKVSIEAGFLEVGDQAGLKIKEHDGTYKPINEIISKIYRHFAARKDDQKTERKVLFVFDNVTNNVQLESFIPKSITVAPFIIVTSNCKYWDSRFVTIHLDVFQEKIAYQFLTDNLTEVQRTDENKSKELLCLLEMHPLAIQQAISYIDMNRMTVKEYVELFKTKWNNLLSTPMNQGISNKPVFKTFTLSIDNLKITENSEVSFQLLNIVSFLDGKHIEKGLLLMFFNNDMYQLNEILTKLHNYSLINISPYNETRTQHEQIITMHSLIQRTVKNLQYTNNEVEINLDKILDIFFINLSKKLNIKELGKYWFNHYVHIFNQPESQKVLLVRSVEKQALLINMFYAKGQIVKLLEILRSMEEILKEIDHKNRTALGEYDIIGSAHPFLFTTQHNIAYCLMETGMYEEALDVSHKNAKFVEILGQNHPSMLATQHNIAYCLMEIGEYQEALNTFHKVEAGQIKSLGANNPSLYTTQHNIAYCLMKSLRYEEALNIFYKVECRQLKILGSNHQSLLTTRHNIAYCLREIGMYNDALDIFYEIELGQLKSLGHMHPHLLITQHNIAYCLMKDNMYNEALEIFYKVESGQRKTLGSNHPSIITTQHNITFCVHEIRTSQKNIVDFSTQILFEWGA